MLWNTWAPLKVLRSSAFDQPPSTAMTLPFELLLRICAMLVVEGDNATMRQCAVVCSRLTVDCQRHMLATTSISFFFRHRLYKLQEALKTSPSCVQRPLRNFAFMDSNYQLPTSFRHRSSVFHPFASLMELATAGRPQRPRKMCLTTPSAPYMPTHR